MKYTKEVIVCGQPVLDELGMSGGFEVMAEEDAEFMIDLMDTLLE